MKSLTSPWALPLAVLAFLLAWAFPSPGPALAADAIAAVSGSKAIETLLWLNTTQGILVSLVVAWILREAVRRYAASQALKDDDVVRNYLLHFLDVTVNALFARLGPTAVLATAAGTAGPDEVARRQEAEAKAAQEVMATLGDAARRFGISEEGMRDRIARRLDARAAALPGSPMFVLNAHG